MESGTKKVLVIVGLVGLVGSIGLYLYRQYQLLTSITPGFGKIKFNKLSQDALDVDLTLKLTNKSDQSFVVDGYDLNVYLGDTFIANVKSSVANVKINTRGIPSMLPLRIMASPKKLFSKETLPLLLKFIANPMGGLLSIRGTLSIRHKFLYLKDYELDYVLEEETPKQQK